jgi:formamidopyrimidine-DNA glycosylase
VPELPDVALYVEHIERRTRGAVLQAVRLGSPFLLRSVDPPLASVHGRVVTGVRRLGKRIVLALTGDLFLVLHLMIAGRLHWKDEGASLRGRQQLAAFDFDDGSLVLTEAGSRRRASLHVALGAAGLAHHDRGGLEPLECNPSEFDSRLRSENRTLKRALTAPHLLSGIGNAYSDEILHAAGLSPVLLTSRLDAGQMIRLYAATVATLRKWVDALREESADAFPSRVTAFRAGMAVHGRYGEACPACETTVQRIVYAQNEVNYCPRCQTGGRMLADRSLSRLLRDDWPKTVEAWEEELAPPPATGTAPGSGSARRPRGTEAQEGRGRKRRSRRRRARPWTDRRRSRRLRLPAAERPVRVRRSRIRRC